MSITPNFTFNGTSVAGGPLGYTTTINASYAATDGDLFCLLLMQDNIGTTNVQMPAGWVGMQSISNNAMLFAYKFWRTGNPTSYSFYTSQPAIGMISTFSGVDDAVPPTSLNETIAPTDTTYGTPALTSSFVDAGRTALYVGGACAYGQTFAWRQSGDVQFDNSNNNYTSNGGNSSVTGKDMILGYTNNLPCTGSYGPYGLYVATLARVDNPTPAAETTNTWVVWNQTLQCPLSSSPWLNISFVRNAPFSWPNYIDVDSVIVQDQSTMTNLLTETQSTFETGFTNWLGDALGPAGFPGSAGEDAVQQFLNPSYQGLYGMRVKVRALDNNTTNPVLVRFGPNLNVTSNGSYAFSVAERAGPAPLSPSTFNLRAEWWTQAPVDGSQAHSFGAAFVSKPSVVVSTTRGTVASALGNGRLVLTHR